MMDGYQKTFVICAFFICSILYSFVDGCSKSMISKDTTYQMDLCVKQKMQWRDGGCVNQ